MGFMLRRLLLYTLFASKIRVHENQSSLNTVFVYTYSIVLHESLSTFAQAMHHRREIVRNYKIYAE